MTIKQVQELLIQNGQLVADTLRHLADNEIDSDYFAITSTSENGTETECELVITEYARQAAGIVDELIKALEAKDKAWSAQDDHISQQADRIESLEHTNAGLGKALCAAQKRIADLEAVKFKLSDSKLLLLAKDIVENLVDTGSSEPEYTQQYLDWTCKRIRAAGRINGEG